MHPSLRCPEGHELFADEPDEDEEFDLRSSVDCLAHFCFPPVVFATRIRLFPYHLFTQDLQILTSEVAVAFLETMMMMVTTHMLLCEGISDVRCPHRDLDV